MIKFKIDSSGSLFTSSLIFPQFCTPFVQKQSIFIFIGIYILLKGWTLFVMIKFEIHRF